MTPQASVLYAAPVLPEREDHLRALLKSMNLKPGVVDPLNSLVPFAEFSTLHFARILVVTDLAAADRAVYGLAVSGLPDYLVFLAEVDGAEENFRAQLVRQASSGLREMFSCCEGFHPEADLAAWLGERQIAQAATYVNWVGRTVVQEREEEKLRLDLEAFVSADAGALRGLDPQALRSALLRHVAEQKRGGRLTLTPEAETPRAWAWSNLLNLVAVPLILLLASPFLLILLPLYLLFLRHWERHDPAVAPPLQPAHAAQLESLENYDVTNQFNVFGSLKPGRLRRWSMHFFLWIVDYTARHLYNRGGLARVSTIHFARWVSFDGGERMLFSSIYDGSLESYMDDFINKVGFGLNITFSNGIGYPRTRWLVCDGCQDEQVFKRVLRRHQLPTEVWYNANPGLTAANKHRNHLIRTGMETSSMTDREIRQWVALL